MKTSKKENTPFPTALRKPKVFHLSAECYPVAKVGGLADVVGALPRYQAEAGWDTAVVMPYYETPFVTQQDWEVVFHSSLSLGTQLLIYEVLKAIGDPLGFELYVIRIPGLLDRMEVYGHPDEADQWIAFQYAVLQWWVSKSMRPDIVHCHDHHTGLVPFFIQHGLAFEALRGIKTVATVHNGQYQGWMDWHKALWMPAFDPWKWGLLDWDGKINPLAALIKCCDHFTAVSEGYLQELVVQSNGLEGLFAMELSKGTGIVNGIDHAVWNPDLDAYLSIHYLADSSESGKKKNKNKILKEFKLKNPKWPLMIYIGRFATEKGADLLPSLLHKIVDLPLHFIVLGSGDKEVKTAIEGVLEAHPGRFGAFFGYQESLAHRLYAAADYLLMPSRVEPCGLNQLYAMRYGTIPVVRSTGGLKDTVLDLEQADGRGIVFEEAAVSSIEAAIQRVLTFESTGQRPQVSKHLMSINFSWEASAQKYIQIYNTLNQTL
jgi:starch synthase